MIQKKYIDQLKENGKYHINDDQEVYTFVRLEDSGGLIVFKEPTGKEMKWHPKSINKIQETTDPTSGMKFDGVDKLRWDLVPIEFEEVVTVLTKGAKKYADNNWKYVNPGYDRYYAAARRHMEEFRKAIKEGRPRVDKEMGTHLLANSICCLMFLMWMDMNNWENQKNAPTTTPWREDAKS